MNEIDDQGRPAQAEVMAAAADLASGAELTEEQLIALLTWCEGKLLGMGIFEGKSSDNSPF
jgi:hypothetical protein